LIPHVTLTRIIRRCDGTANDIPTLQHGVYMSVSER
jgi:hypothetical protein